MTFRERSIETVKLACNDVLKRVEEIIPDTEGITNVTIVIKIPTETDSLLSVPELTVTTDLYSSRTVIDKIFEMRMNVKTNGD